PMNGRWACAAKLVGLGGGEAGAFYRDPHGLLLEKGDAEGLAQHLLQLGPGIVDRLAAFTATQIGVDHVALDRTGPDDGRLDDQIIEGARLDPRQHGHLGAALDLEKRLGCRPCGSWCRSWDPPPEWSPGRGPCPCVPPARRSRASCNSACRGRGHRPS